MKKLLLISLVMLAGCGSGGGGGRMSASNPPPTLSTMTMPSLLRVAGPSGDPLLSVARKDDRVTISSRLGPRKVPITGRNGRYTRKGKLLAVVRATSNDIRLKDAHGRTLWRLRISRGRVQLRRGEKRVRYEFRNVGDDRITVRHGAIGIGGVRATEQGAELIDARGTRLGRSTSPPDDDMAVLLCHEMSPDLRAILTAALLQRG